MKQKSYDHGKSRYPLLRETIGENLRVTCSRYPEREALVCLHQNYRSTYRSLWNQVEAIAKALVAINVQKGDRIAILTAGRYELVLLQYASARIGAILVNINPGYNKAELIYVLSQSGACMLISVSSLNGTNYEPMIKEAMYSCRRLQEVIFLGRDWVDFLDRGRDVDTAQLQTIENSLKFGDPVCIQYTNAQTGLPKGVTLSHYSILNNAHLMGRRLGYTGGDRICIGVPFHNCFGMLNESLCCSSIGACMVVASESCEQGKIMQAVALERCTSLHCTHEMFNTPWPPVFDKVDLSTLNTVLMGGYPCPRAIRRAKAILQIEVSICYGTTETSVCTQTLSCVPVEKQPGTVGKVQDHLEIKIIDPLTGKLQERNMPGELCIRGYSVMLGYWNNKKATAEAIDLAGWMHSGDLARMDEEGNISILGRMESIITGDVYQLTIEELCAQ